MSNPIRFRRSFLAPLAAVAVLLPFCPRAAAADSPALATRDQAAATSGSQVTIHDDVVGTGTLLEKDKTAVVHYLGTLADGSVFDSSREKLIPSPLRFKMGAKQMIPGFEEGVEGMRVGGVRTVTIPPEKAYGKSGRPPLVPPNATLRFRVELFRVE